MDQPAERPDFEITSEEQARNWVMDLVKDVEDARQQCNVSVPGDQVTTASLQRKAYRIYLVRHGGALGTLTALHRCRKLNDVAYMELRQRVMLTLVPTVVGSSTS